MRGRLVVHALIWPALLAAFAAAVELVRLRMGHYVVPVHDALALLGVHTALGVVVGLPAGLVARSLIAHRSDRAGRIAAVVPSATLLFVLGGLAANVLFLPAVTHPVSVAVTLAWLLVCAALVVALGQRAWPAAARRAPAAALAAFCVGAVVFAARSMDENGPTPPKVVGKGTKTLVIVLIDTLRADHLGIYGHDRDTSPVLDGLASNGVVFTSAYSTSNWTRPSVASLFTSTMPSRHGAIEVNRRISSEAPLLADALAAARYAVGFFTSGANVEAADGYGRNVDRFESARSRPAIFTTLYMKHLLLPLDTLTGLQLAGRPETTEQVDPSEVTARALAWVASIPSRRPLFLYLHYHGPHSPYDPPPALATRLSGTEPVARLTAHPENWAGAEALSESDRAQTIAQYDAEILWHDQEIGRLLDGLEKLRGLDDLALLVTADHGEGFGEHGAWAHGQGLFQEITRVPLIAWSPGRFAPGRRAVPVSLLDVAPTVADLAGVEPFATFDGGSLRPWLEGAGPHERIVFFENPKHGEIGVRTHEWVYFRGETPDGPRQWLYSVDDPEQRLDLIDRHPEVVRRLSAMATERVEMDRSRSFATEDLELDAERIEQLKALGYLQ